MYFSYVPVMPPSLALWLLCQHIKQQQQQRQQPPSHGVFKITDLEQTMFLGYITLQLLSGTVYTMCNVTPHDKRFILLH